MKQFGDVLKQCMAEQALSVNAVSKTIGLNRGWLYNVFTGVKNLPEEKLQLMLNEVDFTPKNVELLRESYYRAVYGREAFDRIVLIKTVLAQAAGAKPPNGLQTQWEYIPPEDSCLVDDENLPGVLRHILNTESAGSAEPVVFTNYPYNLQKIDDIVYCAAAGFRDKKVDFHHILTFERNPKGDHNLKNVLKSARFLKLRQNIWFHYADSIATEAFGTVFPYFFITTNCVLLFDNFCKTNLFLRDAGIAKELRGKAEQLIDSCEALAVFPESLLDLKDLLEPVYVKGEKRSIQHNPCWALFINRDVLENIIAEDLPFRGAYIQIAERYYTDLIAKSVSNTFTLSGAAAFAKTGRLYEAPETIVPRLTMPMRIYMLESLLKAAEEDPQRIRFVDETVIKIPNIDIAYCESFVCISGLVSDSPESYMGEYVLFLRDRHIAADFRNFRDYIERNNFFCRTDFAVNSLRDLITMCGSLASAAPAKNASRPS